MMTLTRSVYLPVLHIASLCFEQDCTITEQGESATGLWTLAFNPKNKDRIIDETNAVAGIICFILLRTIYK